MNNFFCYISSGLFSKAIAQSGTNLAAWSQPAHKGIARDRAIKLADMFKCHKPNHWPKTLNCLRKIPAENITAAFYDFFVSLRLSSFYRANFYKFLYFLIIFKL